MPEHARRKQVRWGHVFDSLTYRHRIMMLAGVIVCVCVRINFLYGENKTYDENKHGDGRETSGWQLWKHKWHASSWSQRFSTFAHDPDNRSDFTRKMILNRVARYYYCCSWNGLESYVNFVRKSKPRFDSIPRRVLLIKWHEIRECTTWKCRHLSSELIYTFARCCYSVQSRRHRNAASRRSKRQTQISCKFGPRELRSVL